MSLWKKLVGRSRSDEKEGREVAATGSGGSLPKDPMSPARVKAHFSPDVADAPAAGGAAGSGAPPPEMAPEAHDASQLLEDDDEGDDVLGEPKHEPARVTSSFKDEDAPHNAQVGYSWAKTDSWMSERAGGMVDYGGPPGAGGKGGAGGHDPLVTSSFRSDVTDYDAMHGYADPAGYGHGATAPVSGLPPGFTPPGPGQPGAPPPLAPFPGGYPAPCWGFPGFPMDPAAMGGMMGFPGQGGPPLSAEDIDAYAEKMMTTARMMQAAAAAQRQLSKAGGAPSKASSSSGPAPKRGNLGGAPPMAPQPGGGREVQDIFAALRGEGGLPSAAPPPKDSKVEESQRTTVMLRNIPNDYSRDMLLELVDEQGFRGSYDFVYLPQDFKRKAGLGYAFINLVSHGEAVRFMERFSGFNDWKFSSQKICEAAWGAPLQGLEQHVFRYKNSPLMHPDVPDEFKPCLFKDGVRIDFPEPTKRVRPPRMKLSATGAGSASGLDPALEGDEM